MFILLSLCAQDPNVQHTLNQTPLKDKYVNTMEKRIFNVPK